MVSTASLAVLATGLLASMVVGTVLVVRRAVPDLGRRERLVAYAASLGVACVIVGGKLWLVGRYGFAVPFLDQWWDEALSTHLPFARGELRWADLLRPHNEHRVSLSRVLSLVLLVGSGQWDPMLQMAAGAVLHAWAGMLLVLLLWSCTGHRDLDVIAAAVVILFVLPFSWENTLWGFQSCVYLLLLTLLLPLALVPGAASRSLAWWTGLALLALAPLTMGSGVRRGIRGEPAAISAGRRPRGFGRAAFSGGAPGRRCGVAREPARRAVHPGAPPPRDPLPATGGARVVRTLRPRRHVAGHAARRVGAVLGLVRTGWQRGDGSLRERSDGMRARPPARVGGRGPSR